MVIRERVLSFTKDLKVDFVIFDEKEYQERKLKLVAFVCTLFFFSYGFYPFNL